MIQPITNIKVFDNSGINFLKCIKIYKKVPYSIGKVGDIFLGVVVSIKKGAIKKKHKKGDIVYCLLIKSKVNEINQKNSGIYVKNINNCGGVIIKEVNQNSDVLNSRLFGYISYKSIIKSPKLKNLTKYVV